MHVHRSAHARNFTVLPNVMLQDRQLSYTARGLLADLLSRPDGRREDGRKMADSSPQGRRAIYKALKELVRAGYYRVEKIKLDDGTIISENHVFDTPQLPGVPIAGPGAPAAPVAEALTKDPGKEPSLPAPEPVQPVAPRVLDERARAAAALLLQVVRSEPRLRIGQAEAEGLAPLVVLWQERGATPADLATALLPGLPVPLHSPVAVLRDRLRRKMPPVPAPRAAAARYSECGSCHDPVPRPGICLSCAGLAPRTPAAGNNATTRAGMARVREAMRAAKAALPLGLPATFTG
ncbi:hypothetical protein OU787_16445 [Kitasatospora sp. YST-16]|uniref:hypothetical protein n=1 Tax=Kitasatospora sp. YST-16 TaxID=2998080 RepID=UPI00228480A0|nr:hypothetical protein [Kitasatospora sp. YST-16]WAL72953.1 hypothetical protein OU787_16445 [Kitasatospora sp. YST-16]WNW39002.1 hypothetical protein RKE32_16400 [Streptomyces sp. Li-HN-5-13]